MRPGGLTRERENPVVAIPHFVRACVSGALLLFRMTSRLPSSYPVVAAAFACAVCSVSEVRGEAAESRSYNLPRGDAATTLKQFAADSGEQIVYLVDNVRGQKTNAVIGEYSAREALNRMLAGTGLVASHDPATGAFVVGRKRPEHPAEPHGEKTSTPAPETGPMKKPNLLTRAAALIAALSSPLTNAQVAPSQGSPAAPAREQPLQLSPFVITEEADDSWTATSTLAGSRLNTPLRDTGASISVLTAEFLKDLGAFDLEGAVGYAVNMHLDTNESTNANDNWALFNYDAARVKVRGVSATVTRNYFRWGLQSDNYNADRIEENRGPNSILFGIGSAGGVVNTMTKQANLARDFRRASVTVGSYDSYRGTVDLNQRVLDGKLAFRLNAVYSNMNDYREHAFNDTRRLHLASTWQPLTNTRIRVDYETGKVENVGVRPAPAFDGVNLWVAAGSPTVAGAQAAVAGTTQYASNARRLTYIENSDTVYNYQGWLRSTGDGDPILDASFVDYTVNPAGPGNRRDADFQALTVFWEQKLAKDTYAELSYNLQLLDRQTFLNGEARGENAQIFADPNRFLPNGDPNPNVGALFFEGGRWYRQEDSYKTHNFRLMLSHEMDFGKWGNYRLAAMAEHRRGEDNYRRWVEAWDGRPFNSSPEHDQNQVWRRQYVTPGNWSTYHAGQGPSELGLLTDIPDPTTPGRLLNSTWVTYSQGSNRDALERQDAALIGGHARYFGGRLVVGVGLRKDELRLHRAQSLRDADTRQWTMDHPDIEWVRERFKGDTRTMGAVGHLTRNVSLFYNSSSSINIPNTGHRILPDGNIAPNSEGKGMDFGVGLTFLDGKLTARINRYVVDMEGETGGGFGGTADNPSVLNNRVLAALESAGLLSPEEVDAREFSTNQSTIDRRLEGYEVNLVGALTKNWRLSLNYSYSDGYASNIAPEVKAWAANTIPWYLQYANVMTDVAGANGQLMNVGQLVTEWQETTQRLNFSREGELILGNRKHKYSVFTRYSVSRGPLKGLFGGGGYRYQGKAPLGSDADGKLHFSKAQGEADAFLGYRIRFKKAFIKDGISLQLNVRNLFDETEPRITSMRPDFVRVARALIVPPRSWRLTASFDF